MGNVFGTNNKKEEVIHIINLLDYQLLKCKHIDGFFKYLLQLSPTLWAVIVTDENDNQIFVESDLSYKESLYKYNHWKEEEGEGD